MNQAFFMNCRRLNNFSRGGFVMLSSPMHNDITETDGMIVISFLTSSRLGIMFSYDCDV